MGSQGEERHGRAHVSHMGRSRRCPDWTPETLAPGTPDLHSLIQQLVVVSTLPATLQNQEHREQVGSPAGPLGLELLELPGHGHLDAASL